ncbi:hypothetical protein, partial [Achromobacter insuavis]
QLRQGTVPGPRGATRGRALREAGRDAAVWRREMLMEGRGSAVTEIIQNVMFYENLRQRQLV